VPLAMLSEDVVLGGLRGYEIPNHSPFLARPNGRFLGRFPLVGILR